MLKDAAIYALTNDNSYNRGCRYFKDGLVKKIMRRPDTSIYVATVCGAKDYEVRVRLDKTGEAVEAYDCTCPALSLYDGACKHIVALLKEIQTLQMDRLSDFGYKQLSGHLFDCFAVAEKRAYLQKKMQRFSSIFQETALSIEPRLFLDISHGRTICHMDVRIGRERLYIVRNVKELLQDFTAGNFIEFGKHLTIDPKTAIFAPGISAKLWKFLLDIWKDEQSSLVYSRNFSAFGQNRTFIFNGKTINLTPSTLERFLLIMKDTPFSVIVNKGRTRLVKSVEGAPVIDLDLMPRSSGGRLVLLTEELYCLDDEARFLLIMDTIYHVPLDFAVALRPLAESFMSARTIAIEETDMPTFFGKVLPAIKKVAKVNIAASFIDRYEIMELLANVYLDYHGEGIAARLEFCYNDVRFNPLLDEASKNLSDQRIIRNTLGEQAIIDFFDAYDFIFADDRFIQEDESKSFLFLNEALPELSKIADIYYTEAFHEKPVRSMPPVLVNVSVNEENLLDVNFDTAQLDFAEIIDILHSYREKKLYHRLKDGAFMRLADRDLAGLANFIESAGIKKDTDAKNIKLPLRQAFYLDALSKEERGLRLLRSKRFKNIVCDIKNPVDANIEPPSELKDVLRDYQKTGFSWLFMLASYRLGGILADDMGLGKTLQVISFLLSQKSAKKPPALVVSPTSLLYNWLDEIEKFAPRLQAVIVTGSKSEREMILKDALISADVIITTYHTLRRDIDFYEKERFSFIFLDEAQQIKNPVTKAAKAVKCLKADASFALTGTPLENSLTELWSLFDFLMPGYLKSRKQFQSQFENAIVCAKDQQKSADLLRYISPFILRRLKKDVLEELPDKVERKMISEMTDEQRKVYNAWFVQAKKEFAAELRAHGFGELRIKILAILTRLRQIACDPSLFLENYEGGSGKLAMLEEVVKDAVASGHRILIFSQFKTMLSRIAERLYAMDLTYNYLDGATPALERMRRVRDFNEGVDSIFLISLKAGGTGLNLTGADMVIHYDPWWNPAVEEQATDRAYRLGQKNNVQVLKFITKDTIEEKIYALQEKKKALIDQVIRPGETFLSKLSEEEIKALFQ